MTQPQSFRTPNGEQLTAALVKKVNQLRAVNGEILDLLAQMDREHVASAAGYPSLAAYVSHATRMAKHVASLLIGYAKTIGQTPTPTGHIAPAPLPKVRELVLDGAVDGEHIEVITTAIKALPDSTPLEVREIVETTLADTARVSDPAVVREQGTDLLARIDQDGREPDHDAEPAVRNELHLRRTRDGGCMFRGRLTKEPTEALLASLGPHAKPHSPSPGYPTRGRRPNATATAWQRCWGWRSPAATTPTTAAKNPTST